MKAKFGISSILCFAISFIAIGVTIWDWYDDPYGLFGIAVRLMLLLIPSGFILGCISMFKREPRSYRYIGFLLNLPLVLLIVYAVMRIILFGSVL